MIWLAILGGVVALGVGIALGSPRPFDQSHDDIDRRLEEPGEHARVKRKTTFVTLLQRKVERGSVRRRRATRRKPFQF